jgi:thiol-disulfide isomerase/thioredoxin
MDWIGSEPLTLTSLRGRVVLIRFWTDTCPFCRASAPALKQLDEAYRERGLAVVGLHHGKPRGTAVPRERVESIVDEWGWQFPVGLDANWAALDRYWLDTTPRGYTSVSFLVDAQGVIRFVHPGPEFHPDGPADHEQCRRDFAELRQAIEALLPGH